MRPSHFFATLPCLLLAACVQAPQTSTMPGPDTPAATAWVGDVAAIASADDNAGRRVAIGQRLEALGISWRKQTFQTEDGPGENLLGSLATLQTDSPLLLLGAHSDRVDTGRGATDNASGSATVLALAKRFQLRPLQHHRVAVAFWDMEERGLLGAQAYVEDGSEKPAMYVNFDVFGWGDTLWLMSTDGTKTMSAAATDAANGAGLGISTGEQYPPTDHRAFLKAGWPAVSYSLVGAEEIPLILQAYAGNKPETMPKVMQVIHHDRDTMSEIDPNAVARGIDAVEEAIRRWDASQG